MCQQDGAWFTHCQNALRKRIEHGACQFPVRESELKHCEPETVKTEDGRGLAIEEVSLPAAHHPDVHSIVQQGGWQALVKNTTWRKQLAQWCCLCGTWCASSRAVKMHLARTHKAEWNPHKTRIEMLCKSQQADITTPCSYCGSTSKEPKSHVVACPVIFQSIFIDLLRHGSRGGGKLLPARTAGGKPEQCSAERPNDWSGQHGGNQQETSDGRGRQGLRKRQAKDKRKQKPPKGQGRSGQLSRQEAPDLQRLTEATAKLALRLADANQVVLQDCGFIWFVSREEGSILPVMFGVSTEWSRIKRELWTRSAGPFSQS